MRLKTESEDALPISLLILRKKPTVLQSRIIINSFIYPLILVVSLLTYMITKGELSPEEINGMALDMIKDGVDTVSAILQLT